MVCSSSIFSLNSCFDGDALAEQKIKSSLQDWLKDAERVVVAGIGNPIRSDDNVGVKIVEALAGKVPGNVMLLEAETVPEGYLYDIEQFKPSHVLLIDAALLGLKPGEAKLVTPEEIPHQTTISSHTLPLRIFSEYIQKTMSAKIAFLLIEPKNVEFGEGLSLEIQKTGEKLVLVLKDLLCNL